MRVIRSFAIGLLQLCAFVVPALGQPSHLWSRSFGDPTSITTVGAAFDGDGNLFTASLFWSSVTTEYGTLVAPGTGTNVLIMSFSPTGELRWARSFGDSQAQVPWAMAVDGDGNVIVVGSMSGSIDFGGGPLVSAGSSDLFVVKLTNLGAHVWSQRFGETDSEAAYDVAVDVDGRIAVTGFVNGDFDFQSSAGCSILFCTRDAFIALFDLNGVLLLGQRLWSDGTQSGTGIEIDYAGNLIVAGNYSSGEANFGGGALPHPGSSSNAFLAKFSSTGQHIWSRGMGGPGDDGMTGLCVDYSDHVVITGYFATDAAFGGDTFHNPDPGAGADAFIAKFDVAGNHLWSHAIGGQGGQWAHDVVADRGNNLYLGGYFDTSIDFGEETLTNGGWNSSFMARYGPSGDYSWGENFAPEGANNSSTQAIAVGNGVIGLPGRFRGTIDFGGGPLTNTNPSNGGQDLFIAAFSYPTPTAVGPAPAPRIELGANRPNPFRGTTAIEYTVGERTNVSIDIYDVRGARVMVLNEGERDAGSYRAVWNGQDRAGRAVSSGVYFYRFEGNRSIEARKMILLK